MSILLEAQEITDGARRLEYGSAEESFQRIADYWDTYILHKHNLKVGLTGKDVALMMTLLKLAREENGHQRDSLLDMAGYIRLASLMAGDEKLTKKK